MYKRQSINRVTHWNVATIEGSLCFRVSIRSYHLFFTKSFYLLLNGKLVFIRLVLLGREGEPDLHNVCVVGDSKRMQDTDTPPIH